MSKDKSKILEDTIKYLKFYREYNKYSIYKSEVKESETKISFLQTSDQEEIYSAVKEEVTSAPDYSETVLNKVKQDKKEFKAEKISSVREDNKWKDCNSLESFETEIKNCIMCSHLSETRTQIVFGYGNKNAEIVLVGEAPGAEEDKQGKPFVGNAGKLLTDILKAINFNREEIYICNILKCRPPENRNPSPEEILNCEPYLYKQLEMIKPKMILALGTFAAQTLLKSKEPLGKLRGKIHSYNGIKMMVTYHPAALLRNPSWKKPTWEDVQIFRKEYDKMKNS